MKHNQLFISLILVFMALILETKVNAQTLQKMGYQSVTINSSNALLAITLEGIKISESQGSAPCTTVHKETQMATNKTNSLVIVPYTFQPKIVIDTVDDYKFLKINLPL